MKTVFALLSSFFAVIPGIAILTTNLGVPDDSLKMLFIGVIEAIGCLSLALILLNKSALRNLSLRKLNRLITACGCAFVVSLVAYLFLYNYSVVNHPLYDKIYFPLRGGADLETKIIQAGGRYQFVEKYFADGAQMLIKSTSSQHLTATTVLFLLLYQLVFTSLVYAFGLAAIRLEQDKIDS